MISEDKLFEEMRNDIKQIKKLVYSMKPEHDENTRFRKKFVNAIVGTAFLALCALGTAVLNVTGILKLQ